MYRKLRKYGARIGRHSTLEDFHQVRIRARRLRHVLEAFAGLYGEAAARHLAALERLQDLLGNYHDAGVRAERLRKMSGDPTLTREASFMLGQLVARGAREEADCRSGFERSWRRVRKKRWRALAAALTAAEQRGIDQPR
jgi:CHAD domain-containing protein